jgi:tRNA modification GTPase
VKKDAHYPLPFYRFNPMPNENLNHDTITAIATPAGQAGIGIIRISGPLAAKILHRIFQPNKAVDAFQTHRLYLGHLVDTYSGRVIDQVLLSWMKAPHTYTREDVVEINSHSGYLLLDRILQIVLREGARLAKPGEFTFRAFVNGRIDLTQAEAIVDLINSKSERGLQIASQQIKGSLREEIDRLRHKALDILAHVEVAIDFPDEEEGIFPGEESAPVLAKDIIETIERIIARHGERKVWLDGINTVILGRVNAGKSSLLNRLLNEERALVTPVPGTTRDVVEAMVHVEGVPLRLMDTAGFRKVRGRVEKLGIDLAKRKMEEADLFLVVIDQSRPLNQNDLDLLRATKHKTALVILNKIDLRRKVDPEALNAAAEGLPVAKISALTGEGIDVLRKAIRDLVLAGGVDTMEAQIIPNLRHTTALSAACESFKKALQNMNQGLPLEIIAADLKAGLDSLGEITGETSNEELLDRIFSQFCIGK